MATRSIVPRADGEGSLGTPSKKWGNLYADKITSGDGNTDLIAVTDMLSPYYARLNQQYTAEVSRKLRYGENVVITFMGDSNMVRSGSLMQTSMLTALNGPYNNKISRIDRAYSGDSAKTAFDRWTVTHGGDITIICYGTNDATAGYGYPDETRVHDYQYWLEKLIIRELTWGKAVVIVTSLPIRNDKRWENKESHLPTDMYPTLSRADIYPFGGIDKMLSEKYSASFFDSKEALNNYSDEIFYNSTGQSLGDATTPFDDVVHYTDEGLTIWGYRLSSIFYGDNIISKRIAVPGTSFATRKGEDPFTTNSLIFSQSPNNRIRYINTGESFGVGDNLTGNRYLELWNGEEITYSFYSPCDDLTVYPCVYAFSGSLSICKLDYSMRQPAPVIDENLQNGNDYGYNGQSSIVFDTTTVTTPILNIPSNASPLKVVNGIRYENAGIRISSKGWHTINIRAVNAFIGVSGLVFKSSSSELIKKLNLEVNSIKSGISNIQDLTSPSDLNNISYGEYYAFSGVLNTPGSLVGMVRQSNKRSDNSIIFQEFFPLSDTSKYWIRFKTGGSWAAWTQIK